MCNEIIISNYDGIELDTEKARNIVREIQGIDFKIYGYDDDRLRAFKAFTKKLNCKRLIYCDCGGIEIYDP